MASYEGREMVQDEATRRSSRRRRRTTVQHRARKDKKESRTGKSSTAANSFTDDKPADLEALRRARLDYIDTPAEHKARKMKYVGRAPVKDQVVQHVHKVSGSQRRPKVIDPDRKHRQRKVRDSETKTAEHQSVYGRIRRERNIESISVDVDGKDEGDISDAQVKTPSDSVRPRMRSRSKTANTNQPGGHDIAVGKQRQNYRRRQSEPIERTHHGRRNSYGIDECQPASLHR